MNITMILQVAILESQELFTVMVKKQNYKE
nr:MAG TPA: hypothetical protein [Caudoviricetes sp.]